MQTSIAVMNATGRTGHRIAQALLAQGRRVVALGRSTARLGALQALGAQVRAGDPTDAACLAAAFDGVTAVYGLLPYDLSEPGYLDSQRRLGEAMAQAVRDAGVRRVVYLSSLGAEQPGGTGLIRPMHDQEERLRAIPDLDLLCLRAGAFMENLFGALPFVRDAGVVADGFRPDLKIPMVATCDIAAAAVQALLDDGWQGHQVREVLGPRDITMTEVVQLLAPHLDMPQLAYLQLPRDALERALADAGLAPDVALLTGELTQAINDGRVRTTLGRNAASTTPTGMERFVHELAEAYRAG